MMINVLFYRALWFLFICTALLGVKCDKMAVTVFHPTSLLPLELLKITSEKLLKTREKRTLFSASVSLTPLNLMKLLSFIAANNFCPFLIKRYFVVCFFPLVFQG